LIYDPTPDQIQACADVIALKDAPILAAAIAARPQRLVILDIRDFGPPEVQERLNCPIQSPGELLVDLRQTITQSLG